MDTFLAKLIKLDIIKIDNKNNAFDFVRLILALFVVFAHSRYLYQADDILHWSETHFDNLHAGTIAIWGFFAISGFLVTSSWQRSNGIVDFVVKRYKRIFPGFWFSIFVCGCFFVPLWYFIKEKTLLDFWAINGLDWWRFMSSNLDSEIKINSVGKVAIDTIDGPWWTIHHEVRAYIFLGFLGSLGFLKGSYRWLILAITFFLNVVRIVYSYNLDFASFYGQWFGDERILLFIAVFMWGVSINLFRDFLPIKWSGMALSFLTLLVATIFSFLPIVLPFCFTYFVLCLCFTLPIRNISKKIGDLSYGIYLYHWPVRLTLQMLGFQSTLGFWQFVGLDLLLTLPLALLSWNFVEKRWLVRHQTIKI